MLVTVVSSPSSSSAPRRRDQVRERRYQVRERKKPHLSISLSMESSSSSPSSSSPSSPVQLSDSLVDLFLKDALQNPWTRLTNSATGGKKEGMDTFDISGPVDLTSVDWENAHHRRAVAASLVQAVYVLERDRLDNRLGADALAPPWWEFFHFQLHRPLEDNKKIYGAIFKFEPASYGYNNMHAPHYVIAFRGTIIKRNGFGKDLKLDLRIIKNSLHRGKRFKMAKNDVWRFFVDQRKDSSIWIAGHSLGSAIAMLAGKNIAMLDGTFLETFLFNSPFVGVPIGKIKSEKVRHKFHKADSWFKAKFISRTQLSNDPFTKLSGWLPSLFVNSKDYICFGYIDYFENRKWMEDKGHGDRERLAAQVSPASLLFTLFGDKTEPMHFLPSATLTINRTRQDAHAIAQWWGQDLQLETKQYRY